MPNPTITIKDKQHSQQLEIRRMAIYRLSKVVEATDDEDQVYYLFFYKERYLNYVTSTKITKRSHVTEAFEKGVVLFPSHPLVETVLSSYPHFKKQSFNDLFKKLQQQYTPQETALIASYFESFIKKDQLSHFIKTLFYKERRDGKLFSCYRILHPLKVIAPNHNLLTAFSGDLQFNRYDELYKQGDESLLTKDPIYVEKKLYSSKHHDLSFQKLTNLYKKQSRGLDLIAISITRVIHTKEADDYHKLRSLIDEHLNGIDPIHVLEDLYRRGLQLEPFTQDLLQSYMQHEKLEELLKLISEQNITLQPSQSQELIKIVNHKEIITHSIPPEGLLKLVVILFESGDDQATDILHQAVASLMNEHDSSFIKEWIQPLRDISLAEPILQKIDEMNRISEDPNQQRRLGELYHYFHRPQQAIECMSWDMELREEDPQPVQWLAKLYNELGMTEEHKAYQQLYIDMMKRSS